MFLLLSLSLLLLCYCCVKAHLNYAVLTQPMLMIVELAPIGSLIDYLHKEVSSCHGPVVLFCYCYCCTKAHLYGFVLTLPMMMIVELAPIGSLIDYLHKQFVCKQLELVLTALLLLLFSICQASS